MTDPADRSGLLVRRPWVITLLALSCVHAPVLQAASLAGLRVLSFAPDRPWNYLAYGLAAPSVACLLWRRHARARLAAYVFLTHETLRGLHFGHRDAVAVALAGLALLQLPSARRYAPPIRPDDVRARLSQWVHRTGRWWFGLLLVAALVGAGAAPLVEGSLGPVASGRATSAP